MARPAGPYGSIRRVRTLFYLTGLVALLEFRDKREKKRTMVKLHFSSTISEKVNTKCKKIP